MASSHKPSESARQRYHEFHRDDGSIKLILVEAEWPKLYIIPLGMLGRCVILVWTPRGEARRIISMRHAHADEEARWFGRLDRS